MDLFRAMRAEDVRAGFGQEDDDVADLGGVIKYIQTETIAEHSVGPPYRLARKYGIDSIRRNRYKIRNKASLLVSHQVLLSEFGQFEAFDNGVATATSQAEVIRRFGDWVGIQFGCADPDASCDPRFPSNVPYFWFSLGNFCPNLPWEEKGTKQRPNPKCAKDIDGQYILGGQCPGGFDVHHRWPMVEPTGQRGCTYSYGRSEIVLLDELVGITREDCGGRSCEDFADFRYNCSNGAYRRQFSAPDGREIETSFCVEYDIHPACDACGAKACQDLLRQGRRTELGIPFWRGRCDALANQGRMEALAAAFDIKGAATAHRLVDDEVLGLELPCLHQGDGPQPCSPNWAGRSGPYCSRSFSGVCQSCFIAGTVGGKDVPIKPRCPFDVLNTTDYRDRARFPGPQCRSRRPRDECCLYTGTCDGTSDPLRASLDDDGFALVAARQSTSDMAAFLRRAFMAKDGWAAASSVAALMPMAHKEWALGPTGRSLSEVLAAQAPGHTHSKASAEARLKATTVSYRSTLRTVLHEGEPVGEYVDRFYALEECEAFCTAKPECHSFAYEAKGLGYCYLKDRWISATSELVPPGSKNSGFRTYYQVAASETKTSVASARPLLSVVPTNSAEDREEDLHRKDHAEASHKKEEKTEEEDRHDEERENETVMGKDSTEKEKLQTDGSRLRGEELGRTGPPEKPTVERLRQEALNATARAEEESKIIASRLVDYGGEAETEVTDMASRLVAHVRKAKISGSAAILALVSLPLVLVVVMAGPRRQPGSKDPPSNASLEDPPSPGGALPSLSPGSLSPSRRRLLLNSERDVVRTLSVVAQEGRS